MKKRTWMTIMALLLMATVAVCMTACGNKAGEQKEEVKEEAEEQQEEVLDGPELSEDQMDDLYQQAAEKTLEKNYAEYMPDEIFGHGEAFNIERDGDKGTWDVYLVTGEYAVVDGKAYLVSGANGEAILKFDYTKDGPKLTDVEWSADGGDHEAWIEEHFSEEGLKNWTTFMEDEKELKMLNDILDQKASDGLKVPVEKENLLEIDPDKGTYKIVKTIESGDPAEDTYKFDTETIKEGKLEDLK